MNPRIRPVWVELDDRPGDVHARGPFGFLGVNVPANFQHIRMGAKLRGDTFQFIVGFQMIPKLQPALGGAEMVAVRYWKRFHVEGHVLSRTSRTNAPTSGSFEARGPATLSSAPPYSPTKRRRAASAAATPPALERWSTGLPCFRASSTGFREPPVSTSPMEKTTVPSESRAFHSVRWT